MAAKFPKTWEELVKLLDNSPYLSELCTRAHEQQLKNGKAFNTVTELVEFYASNSLRASPDQQRFIKEALHELYGLYPNLPKVTVYFVVVNTVEFGNTSFTICNVVFLNSTQVYNKNTVMHEITHVVERLHPHWFDRLCEHVGFKRWNKPYRLPKSAILNPDAEVLYVDKHLHTHTYAYSGKVRTISVDLKHTNYHSTVESKVLLGASLRADSIAEMFASRLTSPEFTLDAALRQKVNDVLNHLAE